MFSKNSDSLLSQVFSTSNTSPHVRPIHTDHSEGSDTLLSSILEASFSSTIPLALFKIVNLPLCQSICIRKSTKLPNFVYFCCSSSFTLFLALIHCLSRSSSYKEALFDPFWQQAVDEELSALHKTNI